MYNNVMKRVAVLRGGPSEEYSVSMQTGKAVLEALPSHKYVPLDIIITKGGEWLQEGFVRRPDKILETADAVFIALHGSYGEDGQVQKIIQRLGLPFTGSSSLPSAIAFNKELTKNTVRPLGIKTPKHRKFNRPELAYLDELIDDIATDLGRELFVKPLANGSSFGARYTPTPETLRQAIEELSQTYEQLMIEEYIRGREASVGILSNFRNEYNYSLPVIEIIPPRSDVFFTATSKYNGLTEEIVPGRFSYSEKDELARTARMVHEIISCSGYSRSDFIVRNGEVYFLEINTLPGLAPQSLYPKASASVGLAFPDLIDHLLENASR
jgi:D-alanine-D-alanine ligase